MQLKFKKSIDISLTMVYNSIQSLHGVFPHARFCLKSNY